MKKLIIEEGESVYEQNGIVYFIVKDIIVKKGATLFVPPKFSTVENPPKSGVISLTIRGDLMQKELKDEGIKELIYSEENHKKHTHECPRCGEVILPRLCSCKINWDIHERDKRGIRIIGKRRT